MTNKVNAQSVDDIFFLCTNFDYNSHWINCGIHWVDMADCMKPETSSLHFCVTIGAVNEWIWIQMLAQNENSLSTLFWNSFFFFFYLKTLQRIFIKLFFCCFEDKNFNHSFDELKFSKRFINYVCLFTE